MEKTVQDFFDKMMEFFPPIGDEIKDFMKKYDNFWITVVIEDILMPKILKMLIEDQEKIKLMHLFGYIEDVVIKDTDLRELLSITMMEILGNDRMVLDKAKKYLGPCSLKLQIEADRMLGRNVSE